MLHILLLIPKHFLNKNKSVKAKSAIKNVGLFGAGILNESEEFRINSENNILKCLDSIKNDIIMMFNRRVNNENDFGQMKKLINS